MAEVEAAHDEGITLTDSSSDAAEIDAPGSASTQNRAAALSKQGPPFTAKILLQTLPSLPHLRYPQGRPERPTASLSSSDQLIKYPDIDPSSELIPADWDNMRLFREYIASVPFLFDSENTINTSGTALRVEANVRAALEYSIIQCAFWITASMLPEKAERKYDIVYLGENVVKVRPSSLLFLFQCCSRTLTILSPSYFRRPTNHVLMSPCPQWKQLLTSTMISQLPPRHFMLLSLKPPVSSAPVLSRTKMARLA